MARRDVTPPVGIRHRNWGAQVHEIAEGVHRPLTATVLTLQTRLGDAPVVVAGLDLGWWRTPEDEWFVRGAVLQGLGLSEDRLLLCLSHTHAGPTTHLGDEALAGGALIRPYLERVVARLAEAIDESIDRAEEATLDVAYGYCDLACRRDVPDVYGSRYLVGADPAVTVDRRVTVGRVSTREGRRLGTVLGYACHPTTLAWENRLLSPDYVGAAREAIEGASDAPCLFLQGWSGDLGPRDGFVGDPAVADRNGRCLAYAALATLEGMLPAGTERVHSGVVESGAPLLMAAGRVFEPDRRLSAAMANVPVPLKPMPSLAEIDRQIADAVEPFEIERLLRKRQTRRSVGEDFRLSVWLLRAGEVVFAALPGEMTSPYADDIRCVDPDAAVFTVNVANGWYGYLPEKAHYGRDQYSVWQTIFGEGAAEAVSDTLSSLVR